ALLQRISAIAQRQEHERVSVEIKGGLTRPAFTAERSRALFSLAAEISAALNFNVFEVEPTGGGSDGNFAAALGVSTLDGLGPVSHNICSRQETMELPTLASRGAILHEIIRRIPSLNSTKR